MSSRSRTVARLCVTAVAAATALSLAACGGSNPPKKHTAAPSTTAVSSSATPTPAPRKPPATDPLTGGKPSRNAVIAVKIDDVAAARPQVGVDQANIVYVEEVEGGLTRLIAVYHTVFPSRVGPVRSARANDPQILASYGPIAYVASGGGGDSLQMLDRSSLKATINDRGGPGFSRDDSRPVPHNLFSNLTRVPTGGPARSIGWQFSSATTELHGTPTASSLSTVVGSTGVGFRWDARANGWVRVIDGALQRVADGAFERADNVIVQFCKGHTDYADIDPAGNPGHFTETVGSGRVVVYRDQHAISGTWNRPNAASGTTLTRNGQPILLKPGTTWVVLVATNAPLH